MAKSFIIFLLCLSSVYGLSEMKMDMNKNMMVNKMDDTASMDMTMTKLKRDSYPYHSTPCPPYSPHYHKPHGWHAPEYPKVQYVHQPHYEHKPVVSIVKPHVPSYHHGWQNPWQNAWQPNHGWQPKVVVQKPHYSYAPHYHKPMYHVPHVPSYHHNLIKPAVVVKPDCPPYPHHHGHTGIVYAPQHQYHHQPEYVKVVKPVHHAPPPVYHHQPVYHHPLPVHHPPPVYHHPVHHSPPVYHHPVPIHHPAPVYHHPVHVPKVEICDK